ncbi:MAG: CADD family putative folate metabolism protein [Anaerolineaceae bacterium]
MIAETSDLEARINAVLETKSLLKHPFYTEWTKGVLSRERLQEYARQYYHFEVAFPRFLSAIHSRTESPEIRQLILDNMWDEEHGPRNHPALWLEFAAALGVSADEVRGAEIRPETAALITHFNESSKHAPVAEAMATLFAYEGQVPAIAWQKIKGLTEHYGFTPKQFEFFSVHLVADIAHAGAEMDAIRQSSESEDAVVEAIESSCDRLLGFLDGCYGEVAA